MSSSSFSQIINSLQRKGDYFEIQIPATWMQGRASFGGLVAALGVEALQQTLGTTIPLRTAQVAFSGPVGDGLLRIETTILRQGRSVTSMRADLIQGEQIACTVLACFGASRESALSVAAPTRPNVKSPDESFHFPRVEGLTPKFLDHFDIRLAEGVRPFTGGNDKIHGIWARFFDAGPASMAHIIALADTPPPIPLTMLSSPANGSSLTWSLEFLSDDIQANADDWWYVRAELTQCSQGYNQQRYSIWSPSGQAIALATQVMTVFA